MKNSDLMFCLGLTLIVAGLFIEPESWGMKMAVLLVGAMFLGLSALIEYYDAKEEREKKRRELLKQEHNYSSDFDELYKEILLSEIQSDDTKKEQLREAAQVLLLQDHYNNDIVADKNNNVKR